MPLLGFTTALARPRRAPTSTYITLATKVRLQKAKVIEMMLYGCVTWTITYNNFGALRQANRGLLPGCLKKHTSCRSTPDYHMLPYCEALKRTGCKSTEATVMRLIFLHTDESLPNIVIHEVMIGEKKAGQPARRPQQCVTEHCSDFGINANSWTQFAEDYSEWYQIVTRGG